VRRTCEGKGTILIDFKPKRQTWNATGMLSSASADRIAITVSGKVTVDGLPLRLGRRGQLRRGTGNWRLEGDRLVGQTRAETVFRALFISKRFHVDTDLSAQRGTDVKALVGRSPKNLSLR
jgi:hypothetical protein